MIEVKNLRKIYGQTTVLHGLDFSISRGEQCVIRGASGSGKSTFLYLLGGLEKPTDGQIFFEGDDISNMDEDQLACYRNQNIGFVFQFHFLLSSMNCLDNILLPARIGGEFSQKLVDRINSFAEILKVENLLKKYPFEISGGEQQRINIIRALSLKPKLLLCDEPTGNLDSKNSQIVSELITSLAMREEMTLMAVTHDDSVASHFKRKSVLEDGQFV